MLYRRCVEWFWKTLMIASLVLVIGCLVGIFGAVIIKGVPTLSFDMLTKVPSGGFYFGKEGGIANAIAGSFYLATGAVILSALISLPVAFALQREYLKPSISRVVNLALDVLWGTPSIVYGAIGFAIMVFLGIGASLGGGILVLTFIMMPIMTRAMSGVIKLVPAELKEASYAMGATRFETTARVVFRQALPGMATAVLLAFGRGIGDTAAVLFTAGYTDHMPSSLADPVASLPLAIFFQLATPIPEVQQRAYAAALVLLVIVLAASIVARLMARRLGKHAIG